MNTSILKGISGSYSAKLLTATIVAASFGASAHGAVLFEDDFETATVGAALTTSGPWGTAGGATNIIVRDEVTATPFGAVNQYLDFNDSDALSVRVQSPDVAAAKGALTTFSFDFQEPDTGGGSFIFGYSNGNGDLNSAGRRLSMNLSNGFVTGLSTTLSNTYSFDTSYRIYVIFNDTASTVAYSGGSIDPYAADVWLQQSGGSPVLAGKRNAFNLDGGASGATSYRVGLRSFSSNLQQVLIDNVSLDEGAAAVPEPSSMALLGLSGLLVLRRRRG